MTKLITRGRAAAMLALAAPELLRKATMPEAVLPGLPIPAAVLGRVRAEAGGNVEKLLGDVKAELTRIGDEVKRTAEDALKQAKDAGGLSAETKAKADKLIADQNLVGETLKQLQAKLEELSTRGLELEQKLGQRLGGRGGADAVRSVGQQVVDHDDLKTFAARGAKGTLRIAVNQAITSAGGSAGDLIWSDRDTEIVTMPRRQLTIRNLIPAVRTTSSSIEYAKMITRTNNAAVVSEGVQKPESNYVWDRADALVRTIAHWVHVSRQAMDDAAQLQGAIDTELRFGLDFAEEVELLNGDGTGQHLSGLVTEATAYAPAFTPSAATLIDTLRLAILQASLAEYPADGIVLHPTDWARVELTKDGQNQYIVGNPFSMIGPTLWGKPVVPTQAMALDTFLVGAFRVAATIYDRMDAEVLISSEDRDNFIKNMLTVRAEKRLALAVKRQGALITGDFGFET